MEMELINKIKKAALFVWKWGWCSWMHKGHRCYPAGYGRDIGSWHCMRCDPCGNVFDAFCKDLENRKQQRKEKEE